MPRTSPTERAGHRWPCPPCGARDPSGTELETSVTPHVQARVFAPLEQLWEARLRAVGPATGDRGPRTASWRTGPSTSRDQREASPFESEREVFGLARWGRRCLAAVVLAVLSGLPPVAGEPPTARARPAPKGDEVLVVVQGLQGPRDGTRVLRARAERSDPAHTNQMLYAGDTFTTGPQNRAWVRFSRGTLSELGPGSTLVVGKDPGSDASFSLRRGLLYLFHRDKPGTYRVRTPLGTAGVRGTEFALEVAADQTTTLSLIEGEVDLRDRHGSHRALSSGQIGVIRPGAAPALDFARRASNRSIQWALHYPGVLGPDDLDLDAGELAVLKSSLRLYRTGDLIAALFACPDEETLRSHGARLYRAALLLSVGDVQAAERVLGQVEREDPNPKSLSFTRALRTLIAAVLFEETARPQPTRPTEWLAESYYRQSRADLPGALAAARTARDLAPDFAFAWARLAELEFSFGRVRQAGGAIERSLDLAPRNAQALALKGFLLAAQSRIPEALARFDQALDADPALGNAWLGRGLCRLRAGDRAGGLDDLQAAVMREPQRAILRSYLAKAWNDAGDNALATAEVVRAKDLDAHDPTAWLYSALMNQQGNRINQAVADLLESQNLNDERAVYRSRLLLDQDRAVRSANLATVYADAGFEAVALREATRAANVDYANAAAHGFLAHSYNALRDPHQVNLRYETAWFSEYLLANLLAPVGAGPLSQTLSQNEYSKLFERDGLRVANETLWTSNGDWLERGAQTGQFGNFEYALDAYYRSEVGQRPNADLEQLALDATVKQQLGLADTLFLQTVYYDAESGDVRQLYTDASAHPNLRVHERHEPLVLAGWHHQWQPGLHTLALVSPWNSTLDVTDPDSTVPMIDVDETGAIAQFTRTPASLGYSSCNRGVSAELQQLWQGGPQTLIAGLRYQAAEFETEATLGTLELAPFPDGEHTERTYQAQPNLERLSLYAYDQWAICTNLLITAGVVYDRLTQPINFRSPPLVDGEDSTDLVSPKAGLTVRPWRRGTVRGAFTRSLTGASLDQSFRLEPVQVAGFDQAFRGLMPESLVGSVGGQQLDTWGVAFDQDFPTRTYLTVAAEHLESAADRVVGIFEYDYPTGLTRESSLDQQLDFTERTLGVTVSQLVGRDLAFTAGYRLSEAELAWTFPAVPEDFPTQAMEGRSVLNTLEWGVRFNHPSGFFARWDSVWNRQSNRDDAGAASWGGGPGDDFWQHNLWLGWRFLRRHAELAIGLLNLTDEDYQLHPLNWHPETYRDRTVAVSGRFSF